MVRDSWLRPLGRFLLAQAGAFGLWAFSLNRTVIQWVDGPHKMLATAALLLGLSAFAAVSALRFWNRAWLRAWLFVLVVFGLGEIHLLWLRHSYRADRRFTAPWPAVTTTNLELRKFTVAAPPGLGASRVRVLHVSDVHATDAIPETYVARLGREMRATAPDLVVLTGDYISRPERLPFLQRWLTELPAGRLGSYAVLGNHDHWTGDPAAVRAVIEHAGVELVTGRCADLTKRGASLSVCGTEVPWGEGAPAKGGSLPRASVVLSHTPDNVYALADEGAFAVFAGHTHAGQIRLPFLGALVVPSDYGRRFDEGHFVVGQTHLFVSAGVGADQPPLRLWCPPELVVVDLVSSLARD